MKCLLCNISNFKNYNLLMDCINPLTNKNLSTKCIHFTCINCDNYTYAISSYKKEYEGINIKNNYGEFNLNFDYQTKKVSIYKYFSDNKILYDFNEKYIDLTIINNYLNKFLKYQNIK